MKKQFYFLVALGFLCVPSVTFAMFDANLSFGSKGSVVSEVQQFLNDQGLFNEEITGNFYAITKEAVINFQKQENITPAEGDWGPITRTRAREIIKVLSQNNISPEIVLTQAIDTPDTPKKPFLKKITEYLQQVSTLVKHTPSLAAVAGTSLGSITPSTATAKQTDTVTVSWNVSGTTYANDWIIAVPSGVVLTDSNYTLYPWFYTGGTVSGSKTMTLPINFPAGTADFAYLQNDSVNEVGRSNGNLTVTLLNPSVALSANKTSVVPGGGITISWTTSKALSTQDQIFLVPTGKSISWCSVGTAPGVTSCRDNTGSVLSGSKTFTLGYGGFSINPGYYDIVYVTALPSGGDYEIKRSVKAFTIGADATTDVTPPTVPTNFLVVPSALTKVNLSWNASTDAGGVAGYKIYKGGTLLTTTSNTSYIDTSVSAGSTNTYSIAAYDIAGNTSAKTTTISVTMASVPPTLSSDKSSVSTGGTVSLSWSITGTTFLKDWVTVVPTGGTWSSALPYFYTNAALSGTKSLTLSYSPGVYDIVYYYNDDLYEIGRKVGAITVGGAADTTKPTTPGQPSASSVTQTTLTLNWTASTDAVGVTGYTVFKDGTPIGTPTTNSYNVTGLTAGTAYSFTVSAKDAAGNTSALSLAKVVTTVVASDTTAPTTPGQPSASSVTESSLSLAWAPSTDNVAVANYRVYKDGVLIGSPTTNSGFFVTGLTAGISYTFTVVAVDAVGNTSNASVPFVTVTFGDTISPTTPGQPTVSALTQTSLILSWVMSVDGVGVAGYRIFKDGLQIATTSVSSYLVIGLQANTAYTFTINAFDAAGNTSALPTPITVSTLAESSGGVVDSGGEKASGGGGGGGGSTKTTKATIPPASPKNVTAFVMSSSAKLSWSNPADVTFAGTRVIRKLGEKSKNEKDGALVYAGIKTTVTDTKLKNDTAYNYALFGYNKDNKYSAPTYVTVTPSLKYAKAGVTVKGETATSSVSVVSKSKKKSSAPELEKIPTKNLKFGSKGSEVKILQQFLNKRGFLTATSGPGSLGKETTTFTKGTQSALIRFQETYTKEILTPQKLKKGTGRLDAQTRKVMERIRTAT